MSVLLYLCMRVCLAPASPNQTYNTYMRDWRTQASQCTVPKYVLDQCWIHGTVSIPNKPLVSDSMHLLSLFKSFQDDVRLHLGGGLVPVLIAGMLIWWDSLCASCAVLVPNPDIKELSCSLANNYANPRFGIIRVTMRALTSSTIDYHSDCRDSLMIIPPFLC